MNAPTAGEAPAVKASTASALTVLDHTPPEVVKAKQQVSGLMAVADAYVIDSPMMYQAAADDLVLWRNQHKALEQQRVFLKAPFLEGCRRIDAMFDAPKTALEEAGKRLSGKMAAYKAEQDRIAEEARRAAEEQARREREELERQQREAEERARAAREEAERAEREARERAEAERRQREAEAEAARKAGDEEAARRAEAEARAAQEKAEFAAAEARMFAAEAEAAAAADAAEAQAALDIAEIAPPVPVAQSAAVATGVSARTTWKVKSVDKAALVKAAAAALANGDDTMLAYLVVDEKALNGVARALKSAARVPGVVFAPETSMAATGRKR